MFSFRKIDSVLKHGDWLLNGILPAVLVKNTRTLTKSILVRRQQPSLAAHSFSSGSGTHALGWRQLLVRTPRLANLRPASITGCSTAQLLADTVED